MNKRLHIKKKICITILLLCVGITAFAQNPNQPYNVVMNIYDDPKTTMAFNWFTDAGVMGGEVQVMLEKSIDTKAINN